MKKIKNWFAKPISGKSLLYMSILCAVLGSIDAGLSASLFDMHSYGLGIAYVIIALIAIACSVIYRFAYRVGKNKEEK